MERPDQRLFEEDLTSVEFRSGGAKGMWGVAPEHKGKHGHPLVASRGLIDAFLAAPVTSNAREVKREHAEMIVAVAVSDSVLSIDVNTPEEYVALSMSDLKPS